VEQLLHVDARRVEEISEFSKILSTWRPREEAEREGELEAEEAEAEGEEEGALTRSHGRNVRRGCAN
jgi:hypothetical protein